jgi:uncharacterized protein YkwD
MDTPAQASPHSRRAVRRTLISLLGAALAVALFAAPSFGSDTHALHRPAALEQHALSYQPRQMTAKIRHFYAKRMLDRLNRQRHRLGRRPLTMNVKLIHSAHGHDLRMARRNKLKHKLPGEAFFADRITNAGYHWRSAGENIGWTSVHRLKGLLALEDAMFHEKAPVNGHRLNIINRAFRNVGIDVYWDSAHHKLWFTQDFGQPA